MPKAKTKNTSRVRTSKKVGSAKQNRTTRLVLIAVAIIVAAAGILVVIRSFASSPGFLYVNYLNTSITKDTSWDYNAKLPAEKSWYQLCYQGQDCSQQQVYFNEMISSIKDDSTVGLVKNNIKACILVSGKGSVSIQKNSQVLLNQQIDSTDTKSYCTQTSINGIGQLNFGASPSKAGSPMKIEALSIQPVQ